MVNPAPPLSPSSLVTVTATFGIVLVSALRTVIFITASSASRCLFGNDACETATL